ERSRDPARHESRIRAPAGARQARAARVYGADSPRLLADTAGMRPADVAADRVAIVGAGIFGVTAALELRRRGRAVSLLDPGPVPHPNAASTDISKVVRLDYGADEFYMALMEHARGGWRAWNAAWGEDLFHEDGFVIMTRGPMLPGGFEHDSFALLQR